MGECIQEDKTPNMAAAGEADPFAHLQDVLGSLQMIKRYTVISLCFRHDSEISHSGIETDIKLALHKLGDALPFLAGKVIYEGRNDKHTGIAKIVPHHKEIQLVVNDLTKDPGFPDMNTLSETNYPMRNLPTDKLVPLIAVTWSTDDFDKDAPVLMLQANLVRGGLILTFSVNHATTDMTGLGMIISLFAKAYRGELYTEQELSLGNQARTDAVPLLGPDFQPGTELNDSFVRPSPAQGTENSAANAEWVYFNFAQDSAIRLKRAASEQEVVPYITTDDAICTLCWQAVTRARKARLRGESTTFARPLSVRKYLGLKGYLGYMVDVVYEHEIDVADRPLGEIAGRLRRIVQQDFKIKHHIQAFSTVLDKLDDKTKLVNGAQLRPNSDVVVSSYANVDCCQLSFGSLGTPEVARRPKMPPWPSLIYIMPKSKNGDLAVAVCLDQGDLLSVRQDHTFAEYAEYIG